MLWSWPPTSRRRKRLCRAVAEGWRLPSPTYPGFGATLALPGLILILRALILVFEGVAGPAH